MLHTQLLIIVCLLLLSCIAKCDSNRAGIEAESAYYDGYDESAYYDEEAAPATTGTLEGTGAVTTSGTSASLPQNIDVLENSQDDVYYDEEETTSGDAAAELAAAQAAAVAAAAAEEVLNEKLRKLQEEQELEQLRILEEQEMKLQAELAEQMRLEAERNAKRTYKKSLGNGVARVAAPLVNDRYVNITALLYGCVLQSQLGMKEQNKNASKVARNVQQTERRLRDEHSKLPIPDEAAVSADGTATPEINPKPAPGKEKKLTFRDIQEQRRAERAKVEAEKEALKGKFQLGVSCETMICGSCKIIVEEFASAVVEGLGDPRFTYIEDILPEFCKRKEIVLKYGDIVAAICFAIYSDKGGFREAILLPFERDDDWLTVRSDSSRLFAKKQQACTQIGACTPAHFYVDLKPKKKEQEHWDNRCYVCQALAHDLEERVQLSRGITESNIVEVVRDTCSRLSLAPELAVHCLAMTEGKFLDDISWITKVHSEALIRRARGEVPFANTLCEQIKFCERYIDPEELKKQEEQKMEQVFF